MKALLSLIISGALVVSGFGQTRNVLVGTNNAVVQPTNFWSADASNARTGLGLGTAATNPASAFQVSSATLSNLATSNGAVLTNLSASNIVGTLSLGQGGTGSTNASDARTALGLGTASTNPASAFQASSANLTNLAANNGGSLTNLQATSLVGVIPSSNIAAVNFSNLAGTLSIASGGTSATNAANARQNLGSTTVGDAVFIATNAEAARTAIGATTVGSSLFTLANPSAITFLRLNADNTATALSAADFRTALSLGTASTNPASAFQPSSSVLTNLAANNGSSLTNIPVAGVVGALATNGNGAGLTNLTAANITGTVALASNVTGTIAISNGGSGATTAGGARTNLGLGATNTVQFENIVLNNGNLLISNGAIYWDTNLIFEPETTTFETQVSFVEAAATRTNLGLGWPALTNTTASGFQTALFGTGTNPVLVNTNGEVVSPTNFWQAAPIATTLQNSVPEYIGTTISTNAATNARLLFLFSLSGVQTGVTNVITLPTNGSTFNGDVATITHSGPTNSVTAVRQLGASTNIITLNQPEEAVRFLYRNNQWTLMDNISYVEPIYFSGTNAAANAAASRTNLGLGAGSTNTIGAGTIKIPASGLSFNETADNTNVLFLPSDTDPVILREANWNDSGVRSSLGLGATNNVTFSNVTASGTLTSTGVVTALSNAVVGGTLTSTGVVTAMTNLNVGGAIAVTNAALTRTNLGLPLDALTNTSVTNFQKAIFYTNTAPSNIGGNLGTIAAWIEIVASNGVTYKVPAYTNVP